MDEKAIYILKFIAWLNLFLGCIGSIITFIGWGTVFVSSPTYDFISHYETNPIAIALAVALLIEGILGCVFLLVICSMAEMLITIRKNIIEMAGDITAILLNINSFEK